MSLELIGIGYSPWTQKARWALNHHRIEYQYSEHLIMVGIPLLRMKTGRWLGAVTAPSLVGTDRPLLDSFAIARWADGQGERELKKNLDICWKCPSHRLHSKNQFIQETKRLEPASHRFFSFPSPSGGKCS